MADEEGQSLELGSGDGGEEQKPTVPADVQARLDALEAENNSLKVLADDADVKAVLEAKKGGKSLRLVVGDGQQADDNAAPALPADSELDGMSGSALLKVVLSQVGTVVGKALEQSPLAASVAESESERAEARKTQIKTELGTLVKKYPDFATYKKEVYELAKDRKVGLEEAYVIARMRAGKGLPTTGGSRSVERPTDIGLQQALDRFKKAPARAGRRGFQEDLAETLAGIDIDALDEE
jgi:hypothetical protein